MVDSLTPEERSRRMASVGGKNTKPEMTVRRLVHSLGFRYRLHGRKLPGRPDLVFKSRRKAIFVHGCFWHHHGGCRRSRLPSTRVEFWRQKMQENVERDRRNQAELSSKGWAYMIVWECELDNISELATRIANFLQ
jgi:DNA mismatch endonuclease (patch repair protein)